MKNTHEGSHFSKATGLQSTALQKMKFFKVIFGGFGVHIRNTYFKKHPGIRGKAHGKLWKVDYLIKESRRWIFLSQNGIQNQNS